MKNNDKPDTPKERDEYKKYDSDYIRAYLDAPSLGKLHALTIAGHPKPTRQRAWTIHNRLKAEIDRQFDERITEGAAVGYTQTLKLCTNADSETVQAQCATKLMEYGDKSKPQKVIIEHKESAEELDAEIAILTERINKAAPKPDTHH